MATITPPTDEFLSSLVQPYLDNQPTGLGFAIGFIGPDFQQCVQFGNLQNQFGNNLTFDLDTCFEIASITKTFTATLYPISGTFAQPANALSNYIAPNGPLNINSSLGEVGLDSLLSYTSGLPRDNVSDSADTPNFLPQPYGTTAMLSYLLTSPPSLAAYNEYQYSNLGFALMAELFSSVSSDNSTFPELLQAQILQPLGMESTLFFDDIDLNMLPQGYDYSSGSGRPCSPGNALFPAYYGAGGLVTTSRDLLKFLSFNMGQTIAPFSWCLAVTQNPASDVTIWGNTQLGLGWFLTADAGNGLTSVWKDGGLAGFNSYIAFLPSDNPGTDPSPAGVFVLINASGMTDSQNVELPCSLANDILLNMQGLALPTDKSVYPSSKRSSNARS